MGSEGHIAGKATREGTPMTLLAMMTGLVEANVRVIVVGGMSVRFHGVNQVTDDVDVCYDTSFLNERAMVTLLRGWRARPAGFEATRPFAMTRQELRRNDTIKLQTIHGSLDVRRVVPHLGVYRDLMTFADTVELAPGVLIPTINLESLIRSKEMGGRPKDREVVHQLRARRALLMARDAGLDDITEGLDPRSPAEPGLMKKPRRRGR